MKISEEKAEKIKKENQLRREYQFALSAHPDCKDPDHPGCEFCEDNEDSEDD
jgi:hypothetical protein